MLAPERLYVTRPTAERFADKAITTGRADTTKVVPGTKRNPDKSVDLGFVVKMFRGGKFVGFA